MVKRILVVEDDFAILETLTALLRYEGYSVTRVRSVERALVVLESEVPDLVLLDYMLQDDTAEPVVAAVRERHVDAVPILLFTAADQPEAKARGLGVNGLVPKPFELDHLLGSIAAALNPGAADSASGSGFAGPFSTLQAPRSGPGGAEYRP